MPAPRGEGVGVGQQLDQAIDRTLLRCTGQTAYVWLALRALLTGSSLRTRQAALAGDADLTALAGLALESLLASLALQTDEARLAALAEGTLKALIALLAGAASGTLQALVALLTCAALGALRALVTLLAARPPLRKCRRGGAATIPGGMSLSPVRTVRSGMANGSNGTIATWSPAPYCTACSAHPR